VAAAELVGAASFDQAGAFRPQGDLVAVQAGANGLLLWLLATSVPCSCPRHLYRAGVSAP
jgi:hypothetical protein